ncbi:MAG: NAD+ synthase [Comamonas sp.]|nr:NAD+ synthase [Comamonas sp.]
MTLSICCAQRNFVVGDLSGNVQKIIAAAAEAYANGARLLLTPELSLCGYAAEDLYLRPAFLDACEAALQQLQEASVQWPGLALVIGHPQRDAATGLLLNMASVLKDGRLTAAYAKQLLPNFGVFDEQRYFAAGDGSCVIEIEGIKLGLLICEDAWHPGPALAAVAAGAQLLAVINASPFHSGKQAERETVLAQRATETGVPLIYAHLVGGQDEVVFDGCSFAVQADGQMAARAAAFEEELPMVAAHLLDGRVSLMGELKPQLGREHALWSALVMAVRDYVGKNRFPGALIGLSGGMDSALVLAIAVDALGPDRVRTVMMPSPYTADISWLDAREMSERVGVQHEEIDIAPQFEAFKAALATTFAGRAEDTTEENLQARIRGTLLMAMSNKFGHIVLTTGNKSEMSTGYCTLYGDMAGGFAVIKDVFKTEVFELARWRNANNPFGTGLDPIPERIITRPPSAELRPDQKDQDSLPAYEVLDAIVARYMENNESISSIVAEGFVAADVERVTRLIQINEYKRRQAPVGPRVSGRSFGKDWRYPITNKFRA